MPIKRMTAEEAASLVKHNNTLGIGGFTDAGSPKVVTVVLAKLAKEEHSKGKPFKVGIIAGASLSPEVDGALAEAEAISFRTPYQTNPVLRSAINNNEVDFFDLHLSNMAQHARCGFYGKIDIAILEAADVTEDGKIILTGAVGLSPTMAQLADIVIVELNKWHPAQLKGIHDILELQIPPQRGVIPIMKVNDRIGKEYIQVDPQKIIIVETDVPNTGETLSPQNETTRNIGNNVASFFEQEIISGRMPKTGLPLQLGIGNTANATIAAMAENSKIPNLNFYTEIIQDSVIDLIEQGRINFASAVSLVVSRQCIEKIYKDLDYFKQKIVLRPVEITNSPEVLRRLGVISINTAVEVDILGNVNSSHIAGNSMMNGLGGSGDFTRNAYCSIFLTTSTGKDNTISKIVPLVSHTDHSEHSVNIIISEYGIADLRGKSPRQRAQLIIENCAHPEYRPLLRDYLKRASQGQAPVDLYNAFAFHKAHIETGDMRNTVFQ